MHRTRARERRVAPALPSRVRRLRALRAWIAAVAALICIARLRQSNDSRITNHTSPHHARPSRHPPPTDRDASIIILARDDPSPRRRESLVHALDPRARPTRTTRRERTRPRSRIRPHRGRGGHLFRGFGRLSSSSAAARPRAPARIRGGAGRWVWCSRDGVHACSNTNERSD